LRFIPSGYRVGHELILQATLSAHPCASPRPYETLRHLQPDQGIAVSHYSEDRLLQNTRFNPSPLREDSFFNFRNTELMVTTHVFIAVSLDGYIARQNDDIDWLLQLSIPKNGMRRSSRTKWIVMGRGSYEKVLTFDAWPYDRPVLVLSRQLAGTPVPEALKGKVQFSPHAKGGADDLAAQNVHRVYLDGGQVIQSFLREGLVADMVITTVPVLLGRENRCSEPFLRILI
jgi:dihydrofolate reductase